MRAIWSRASARSPARLSSSDEIVARAIHLGETKHESAPARARRKLIAGCVTAQAFYKSFVFARLLVIGLALALLAFVRRIGPSRRDRLSTTRFSSRSRRCQSAESIRRRAWPRFVCNRQLISNRANFSFCLRAASPSYCSGATYLVFMKTIEAARASGALRLDIGTLEQLMIRNQRDGAGNLGPLERQRARARRDCFTNLSLGKNFDDFDEGDAGRLHENFLVARSWPARARTFGHLSRNGKKIRTRLRAILVEQYSVRLRHQDSSADERSLTQFFRASRLPANLTRIKDLPETDSYLASLVSRRSSIAEAKTKCGM